MLKGNEAVADILKSAETVFLPSFVIAELKYGFRLGTRQEDNEQLLSRFIANKKIRVVLPNIAIFAHKKGVQLSTHDLWIAALTEQWDVTLVTFDNDFKHLNYKHIKLHLED
jgi:tRNA(fMet)-specific endonuclease VapC